MKSLWEKLFERESKLQRGGVHTQPRQPRLVWLWERVPPSRQVMGNSGSRAEMQPFLEKAPGGLGGAWWSEPEGKGPGCFHANSRLSSKQHVGGGPFQDHTGKAVQRRGRGRALRTEGRTDRRTACLEASAAASHAQALARAGRCVWHQGVARLTEEARTFVKGGYTPLPRGKPRAGAVLLQDSQHAAQGLWSSGALEPWPRKRHELSGIPLGEGSVSRGERGGQMQTPGTPVKPFNGSVWPAACESLS